MNLQESNIQPIPVADIAQALNAINGGLTILKDKLIALTPKDRHTLLKMADGTAPFVGKGVEFADKGTIKLPESVNKQMLTDSYAVNQELIPVINLLTEFISLVSDTRMMAGSIALTEALGLYDYAQSAAKRRVPGAKTVYDEMKSRYSRKKKSSKPKTDDEMKAVA